MSRKPTPVKFCESCGKQLRREREKDGDLQSLLHFNRRKYCNQSCMATAYKGRYRTETPNWSTSHYRARTLVSLGPCARCGSTRSVDRHHVNGNWRDNRLENIELLCRSCHMRAHASQQTLTAPDTEDSATP